MIRKFSEGYTVDRGDAIWHVVIDGDQHGPLSRAQVLAYLHDGQVVGSGLIWRPGFTDWMPMSEVAEFWQPPMRGQPLPSHTPTELPEWVEIETASTFQVSPSGKKWSIWKAANIGLLVSVLTMALQIANGRGVELAAYVQAASVNTITHLAGRILAMPVIFVMIAMIVNAFKGQSPSSRTSATKGAITFVLMLVVVVLCWCFTHNGSSAATSGSAGERATGPSNKCNPFACKGRSQSVPPPRTSRSRDTAGVSAKRWRTARLTES